MTQKMIASRHIKHMIQQRRKMVRLLCLAVKMVWVINFCWVSYFRELGSDIMRRDVTDDDTGMIPYWSYKNLDKGKINNERLQIMNMILCL
jgi:hypothetical protein